MGTTSSANAEKATSDESDPLTLTPEESDTVPVTSEESDPVTVTASDENCVKDASCSSKNRSNKALVKHFQTLNGGEANSMPHLAQSLQGPKRMTQLNENTFDEDMPNTLPLSGQECDGCLPPNAKEYSQAHLEYVHRGARPKLPQNVTEDNNVSLPHLTHFNGDFQKAPSINEDEESDTTDERTKLKKWREAGAVLKDVLNQVGMKMSNSKNSLDDREKEEDPMNLMLQDSLASEPRKIEEKSSVNGAMARFPVLKNATAAKVLQKVRERTRESPPDGKNGQFTVKNALALVRAKTSQGSSEGRTSDSLVHSDEENRDANWPSTAVKRQHKSKKSMPKGSKSESSILKIPPSVDGLVGNLDCSSESSDIDREKLVEKNHKLLHAKKNKLPRVPKHVQKKNNENHFSPSLKTAHEAPVTSSMGATTKQHVAPCKSSFIPNVGASRSYNVTPNLHSGSEVLTFPVEKEPALQHSKTQRKKKKPLKHLEKGISQTFNKRHKEPPVDLNQVSSLCGPDVLVSSSESDGRHNDYENAALLSSKVKKTSSKMKTNYLQDKVMPKCHSRNGEFSLNNPNWRPGPSSHATSNQLGNYPSNIHSNPWVDTLYQDWCLDDVPPLMSDSSTSASSERGVPELIDISSEVGSVSSSSACSMPALTDHSYESDITSTHAQCSSDVSLNQHGNLSGRISPPPLVISDSSSTDLEQSTFSAASLYNPPIEDSTSSDSTENDADDEFECDCASCRFSRTHRDRQWLTVEDETEDEYRWNILAEARGTDLEDALDPGIPVEMPSPLEWLLFGQTVRRDILEAMFQNVILQMLSVHPDLMNNTAPPPADQQAINNLPQVDISQDLIENESQCPICLNNYNCREKASQLPCLHIFHPLCIQAWLIKSGTCPVCRHVL
ncbi:uncharacterized protein LOC106177712 [Lingula anatina]|uniref:RING-type E3 ubiquitin transferase n=1 Tax=Lingula anatina TaxID=7574 RepID=A0A1S3K064_LINAN|nr:uncharacterized protein LOC106177712 [Lingula anatina]|eukprot:XP_013416023.1 uncharacterized protein LOC106177712 [Lingula anatina]